jgi:hypothetical protein
MASRIAAEINSVRSGIARTEKYTGTTNASGLFNVTYSPAFATIPTVTPDPPSNNLYSWVLVSSTTGGFSLRLIERDITSIFGLTGAGEVVGKTTFNVSGALVNVRVTE